MMKKLFFGFLLLFLSFHLSINDHRLELLPDFVGYLLLMKGMDELAGESGYFQNARPFAVGMAIYTAIVWVGDLLAVAPGENLLSTLLRLIALAAALYIEWMLIQGVLEMEQTRGANLRGEALSRLWKVTVAVQAAIQALSLLGELTSVSGMLVLATAAGLVAFVIKVLRLIAWWKSSSAYAALAMNSAEEDSAETNG